MSIRFRLNKSLLTTGLVVTVFLFDGPAPAEMFKWTDENGKVHYTDSISKIPRKFRKKGSGLETLRSRSSGASARRSRRSSGGRSYSATFTRNEVAVPLIDLGNGNFGLDVVLNGRVKLQLLLDTGASAVVLHPSTASRLGIPSLKTQPQVLVSTAGGQEMNPIAVLDSVQVGEAVVPDVEVMFNTHMPADSGLLGMTFLNEFRFEIDRQAKKLILRPLRAGNDPLYGNRPLSWWTERYKKYLTGLNQAYFMKSNSKGRLEKMEFQRRASYYQDLVDRLDRRAEAANLPEKYRDPFGNRNK